MAEYAEYGTCVPPVADAARTPEEEAQVENQRLWARGLRVLSALLIVPGCVAVLPLLFVAVIFSPSSPDLHYARFGLLVGSVLLLVNGCGLLAKSKGYRYIVGMLLGFLHLAGVSVLLILPDRIE